MYRIGMSRDIHRLVKGRPLWIGGVLIDHDVGFEAHSDGDIVLHAVTEALLGSLALGDLGTHFPNTDAQYKDKPSSYFVQYARRLVEAKGYRICNLDVSVVIEAPRLSPHIAAMVEAIGKMLNLAPDQISIKAGTNEGLGYIGQGLGAEATCVVLVEKISDQSH